MTKISSAQNCNRHRYSGSSGFSLLEILIAIGLVALISMQVLPNMMQAFRTTNEAFASKTTSLLKEARDRALLRKKILRFSINLTDQTYWLDEAASSLMLPHQVDERSKSREDREREKKEDPFQPVKELLKSKVLVPKGVKVTAVKLSPTKPAIREGAAELFFYPDGTSDDTKIYLEDDETRKLTISIHPITGQSRLTPGAEGLEP